MHVIFVYFVRGGFRTKIKCIRNWSKGSKQVRESTAVSMVSDCTKISCVRNVGEPRIRKLSAYEIFWIYSTQRKVHQQWEAYVIIIISNHCQFADQHHSLSVLGLNGWADRMCVHVCTVCCNEIGSLTSLMHVTQVHAHPVTTESHCTRLYACVYVCVYVCC